MLLSMAGLMLVLWRGIQSALLLLLATTIAYQWLLFIVLSTEPRYKNGLYLYMVPFVVIAWQAIRASGGMEAQGSSGIASGWQVAKIRNARLRWAVTTRCRHHNPALRRIDGACTTRRYADTRTSIWRMQQPRSEFVRPQKWP